MGEGQTEMRYCLGFVKEVCCARGFKVGGERNMCCGRRRGTEVGIAGGQVRVMTRRRRDIGRTYGDGIG